jgi:hypothetical protein
VEEIVLEYVTLSNLLTSFDLCHIDFIPIAEARCARAQLGG